MISEAPAKRRGHIASREAALAQPAGVGGLCTGHPFHERGCMAARRGGPWVDQWAALN